MSALSLYKLQTDFEARENLKNKNKEIHKSYFEIVILLINKEQHKSKPE